MAVGVRTEDLRKVYHSAPPMAATGIIARPQEKKSPKQPKPEIKALDGLTLEVKPGEIFGLLGPNGAGKSTTIGIVTTRVRATSGHAYIGDHEVWQEQAKVKRLIGVVPQRPNLDFSLTASEILVFHAAYFGIPPKEGSRRAAELLEKFKLTDRAGQLVRGFSGGMMQRMSIARAMMHDPEVLFLDEPSAGLDPQTRILLWEIIREYNELGKTVVLTTHNMEEADALCQRLVIVDHGRVIAQGTPTALKQSIPGGFLLRLHFVRQTPELMQRLQSLAGVREVRALQTAAKGVLQGGGNGTATAVAEPSGVDIYADRGGSLIPEVASLAVATGAELSDVHISEPSLENLFLHHTGRSLRD
ncbi:MAG TPA: ATP-binding cassette domain-containing protein [Candidatus Sulfotelmatobacter sp.]|nr:ATP-binding cassette domain-containing protein [Candidatus Sulfotelmatobacter sp.]